jgi:hypothetical protein
MKKHKGLLLAALFIVLVILINNILNFLLIQPGLSKTIFHEAQKGGYDCIILGASHGSYGLSTEELDTQLNMKTMNMCMGGEYFTDSYYVLKYALKYNTPKLVVLDIDYQYLVNFHKEGILHNSIYNAYPYTSDKLGYYLTKMSWEDYRGTFLKWTNYWQCYYMIPKTVKKKLSDAYKNGESSVVSMNPYDTYVGNGFIYRSLDAKKATTSNVGWNESKVSSRQCDYIKKIVKLCQEKNINIVFTSIPAETITVAQQVDKFAGASTYIQNLANQLGVTYIDFNKFTMDAYNRTADDFWDREGHMYGDAAKRFSIFYGTVVKQYVNNDLDLNSYYGSSFRDVYKNIEIIY